MDKIYFNCTACGKCCNSPPTFLFSDFMEYTKEFIIAIRLNSTKRSNKDIKSDNNSYQIKKHNDKMYPIINNNMISAFPYGVKTGKSCPKLLENGQCGIYETRPNRCRSVPFHATVPESHIINDLDNGLQQLINYGCISYQEKPSFLTIYEQGKISNKEIKKSIETEIKGFIESKSNIIVFINYLKKNGFHIQRGEYDITAGAFVAMLTELKKVSITDAINFFQEQNNLINNTIPNIQDLYYLDMIKTIQHLNSQILKEKFNIEI